MKRAFAIGLLLLFCFQFVGPYLAFRVLQQQIRRSVKLSIKNGVPEKNLHCFRLTPEAYSRLFWTKEDEFRSGGRMFDVVRQTQEDGLIVLLCVNDRDEEKLFASLDQHLEHSGPWAGSAGKARQIQKRLSWDYLFPLVQAPPCLPVSILAFSGPPTDFSGVFLSVPTPPPKSI